MGNYKKVSGNEYRLKDLYKSFKKYYKKQTTKINRRLPIE